MTNTLGSRLKDVRLSMGLTATGMAEKVGLKGRSTWERYERDQNIPNGEVLLHLVSWGFDATWILTGRGLMKHNDSDNGDQERGGMELVDLKLLGRCSEAFGKLYKEMGITLSMADLGSLAGEAYNDVIAATSDPDEQYVVIKALIARRRREILNETNANNQGKLSAS